MKTNMGEYLAKVEIIKTLSKRLKDLRAETENKIEYYGEDFNEWPEWTLEEYKEISTIADYIENYIAKI